MVGVSELLSMPLQHTALVEAAGSRWINAKPSKYAKYIAHLLNKCERYDVMEACYMHIGNSVSNITFFQGQVTYSSNTPAKHHKVFEGEQFI